MIRLFFQHISSMIKVALDTPLKADNIIVCTQKELFSNGIHQKQYVVYLDRTINKITAQIVPTQPVLASPVVWFITDSSTLGMM
jgi:hypothetical protein